MVEQAERFARAVARLEGRPFMHKGRGEALDCLGMIASAYEASIGRFRIDWPDYGAPWREFAHERIGHGFLNAVFDVVNCAMPRVGDLLVFDMGKRRHWHFGVMAQDGRFWHAHLRRGVEAQELSINWTQKIDTVYRISEDKNGNIGI